MNEYIRPSMAPRCKTHIVRQANKQMRKNVTYCGLFIPFADTSPSTPNNPRHPLCSNCMKNKDSADSKPKKSEWNEARAKRVAADLENAPVGTILGIALQKSKEDELELHAAIRTDDGTWHVTGYESIGGFELSDIRDWVSDYEFGQVYVMTCPTPAR